MLLTTSLAKHMHKNNIKNDNLKSPQQFLFFMINHNPYIIIQGFNHQGQSDLYQISGNIANRVPIFEL